ncbi:MAG TPA: NAD(P)-dependent oxidoreductase [Herpetosiphonaceae bacterium]|nr:NAD(P)-dependent oxidoreductase [Herpetosiphonaceae bacterium]
MTQSFTATGENGLAETDSRGRRRVLVTGATGNIGSYFAEHAHDQYDLRLMVLQMDEDATALQAFGEVVTGELGNLERMKELCQGIDTVVHLAAEADPSTTWERLLQANIVGAYHTFVAAKAAGCRRVIFASSIHAVSGYPADVQVKTNEPVNPGDLYGVTKCFGEALGRYMAEQEGLSVIALRIGGFQPAEAARTERGMWMLDAWVSQRDLLQLIRRCIDVENITFAIFHGLSDNRFKRLDISDARQLIGYEPQDDLAAEHPRLRELELGDKVSAHNLSDEQQQSGIREEL